jgi:hypothetical protein
LIGGLGDNFLGFFERERERMSDHVVLYVDRLIQPVAEPPAEEVGSGSGPSSSPGPEIAGPSCSVDHDSEGSGKDEVEAEDEEEKPLIEMAECRICQEEDSVSNLENPCACSGSLKVYYLFIYIYIYIYTYFIFI